MPRFSFALLLAAPLLVRADDTVACGVFTGSHSEARKPSLSYEQVLLLYDEQSQREHFVREVTFDGAGGTFGFVVPTPSRPEVAAVERSPFVLLRGRYPFEAAKTGALDTLGGFGAGNGAGSGSGRGVEVVETRRVGKFTAFVLRADDSKALADWLSKNHLASSAENDRWLERYVQQHFYYVALRYDPPKGVTTDRKLLTSETVRISFATPAPYYPYFEPAPANGAATQSARVMDLWLVTSQPRTPVALLDRGGTKQWVRPLRGGTSHSGPLAPGLLEPSLMALLPKQTVAVQTFQDQKRSREGYGDMVFLPEAAATSEARAAERERLRPLLGVLDGQIAGEP